MKPSHETSKYKVIDADPECKIATAWRSHCRRARIPYIEIHRFKKYATVVMDLYTLPYSDEQALASRKAKLVAEYQQLFTHYRTRKSESICTWSCPSLKQVRVEQAEELAEALFDVVEWELGRWR